MNYVIVDLEATCWEDSSELEKMEIIEIGAVLIHGNAYQVVSEFDQFLKPSKSPILSDFCKNLTQISQKQVDEAPEYRDAFGFFLDWIGGEPFRLCSWGKFDYEMFNAENERYGLSFPKYFQGHINLKELYARAFNTSPTIGLRKALQKQSMSFQGNPHSGIDDAKNAARLAQLILVLDY